MTIDNIPDWTKYLERTETPFLKMIGPVPKIGEKDRFGRTLLGYTEVDEAEKRRIHTLWSFKRDELERMYNRQGFQLTEDEDHDGYYEPIQTPESLALEEEVDALWYLWVRMTPQPIWDREIDRTTKVTWGFAKE